MICRLLPIWQQWGAWRVLLGQQLLIRNAGAAKRPPCNHTANREVEPITLSIFRYLMRDGAAAGLAAIDAILVRGELADYHLAHAARADLCRRLGRNAEARVSYPRALTLTMQAPERRFLERRLTELGA